MALLSGRSVQIPAVLESSLEDIKCQAESALQTARGVAGVDSGAVCVFRSP